MEMRGGYAGKILRVDLTSSSIATEPLKDHLILNYIGGPGVGGKILYDELPPGTDPYSPKNPLLIMTGPLTGTKIPGAVNFALVTKSPLDGGAVATNANGWFGRGLKFVGYDGIILEGASPAFIYLYIDKDKVEIMDAGELVGRDTADTVEILKKKYGKDVTVGCIGIAGENMVRFSGFFCDKDHSASKGGVGAVLGSKKVKAIAIKASPSEIPIYDKDNMEKIIKEWKEEDAQIGMGKVVSTSGMRGFFDQVYELGIVPVKNLTTNDFPGYEKFQYDAFQKGFEVRKNPCPTCNFNHFNRFLFGNEDLKEPSFDTLTGYGANLGITDPLSTVRLITLVDSLGLEAQETSWLMSMLMECYEEGSITKKDLDGIELRWGDYSATVQLMEKIAKREGSGNLYGEGIYLSAKHLGQEALGRAVFVKRGHVPQMMDNRNDWAFLFSEVVTNVGHYEANPNTYETFADGESLGIDYPKGLGIAGNPEVLPRHHALIAPRTQLIDFLGLCMLHGSVGKLKLMVDALNAATGLSFSAEDALRSGQRFINLMRVFNIRNGLTIDDDTISPRYLSAPARGLNAGKAFSTHLSEVRKKYYTEMGWDERGIPLPETLRRLNLEECIRDLEMESCGP